MQGMEPVAIVTVLMLVQFFVFAILVYIFIRGLFLTFDPVKLVCIGVFCYFLVAKEDTESSNAERASLPKVSPQ